MKYGISITKTYSEEYKKRIIFYQQHDGRLSMFHTSTCIHGYGGKFCVMIVEVGMNTVIRRECVRKNKSNVRASIGRDNAQYKHRSQRIEKMIGNDHQSSTERVLLKK